MARAAAPHTQLRAPVGRSCGLNPHRVRTFQVSSDPRFEEKLQDVVGLYRNPLENAAVFSFDEKRSMQTLDRTQPGLPLKKGRCGTLTHDDKRHGTPSLFSALEVASGPVIRPSTSRAIARARVEHPGCSVCHSNMPCIARARVEHPLGVVKHWWGYRKARYRDLAKNAAQRYTLFALANVYLLRQPL